MMASFVDHVIITGITSFRLLSKTVKGTDEISNKNVFLLEPLVIEIGNSNAEDHRNDKRIHEAISV